MSSGHVGHALAPFAARSWLGWVLEEGSLKSGVSKSLAFMQSVLDLHQHTLYGPLGAPLGSLQCLSSLDGQNLQGAGGQAHVQRMPAGSLGVWRQ